MPRNPDPARVAVIADDLTGALEAAARFQGAHDVAVLLDAGDLGRIDARVVAIDVASRGARAETACALMLGAAARLRSEPFVTYKKMDSRLRGQFAHELVALLAAGAWSCALVAPALPEQGRAVREGRLRDQGLIGPSLTSAFDAVPGSQHDAVDLEIVRQSRPALSGKLSSLRRAGARVLVCDAETAGDLDALVRAALTVLDARQWLWCGSGGLAGALARSFNLAGAPIAPRPPRPFLGLIGSPHPRAGAQLDAGERCGIPVLRLPRGAESPPDPALLEAAHRYLQGGVGCFLAAPAAEADEETVDAYSRHLAEYAAMLADSARPATLILSGGDTARAVSRRLGLWGYMVRGEVASGVPVSRPLGPPSLEATTMVTKAGSFGSPELWCSLLKDRDAAAEANHVS